MDVVHDGFAPQNPLAAYALVGLVESAVERSVAGQTSIHQHFACIDAVLPRADVLDLADEFAALFGVSVERFDVDGTYGLSRTARVTVGGYDVTFYAHADHSRESVL